MYVCDCVCDCVCFYVRLCDCVCFCVRLCVPSVFPSPRRPEEGPGCSEACDLLHMGAGTELGSLQEQHIFLTPGPSLCVFSFDL